MLGRYFHLHRSFKITTDCQFKPFGTGLRACIGRAFAWQEALMATALILQNFDLALDDPKYEMKIVQTLTIKPKDFFMRASLRSGVSATQLQERLSAEGSLTTMNGNNEPEPSAAASGDSKPMTILYGSNTGTCQALAQKLASRASQHNFTALVKDMDNAIGKLPTDQPIVIITASYEGQPTDNAARFVAWLENNKDKTSFKGVNYAVFGCGHRDWSSTYQRVPKLVDSSIANLGGDRIVDRGESDAANRDIFGDFDNWMDDKLWPALLSNDGQVKPSPRRPAEAPSIQIEIALQQRATHLQQNVQWAKIVNARKLTAPGEPEKRHIEIHLPQGMSYQVGDYLAVLPLNSDESIKRVMQRFSLPWDGIITVKSSGATSLPLNSPLPVSEILKGYVELSEPANRRVSPAIVY
jgi:cytochrome P450/NADPH-cytochrome P450 reductase